MAIIGCKDIDSESKEDKLTQLKMEFLNKWGHPHLCQMDDNNNIEIHYKPIKLCSHYKKGKAKDEQLTLNKLAIEEANQFKSKFELQREKAFVKNINNTWVAYTFKNFFEARVLVELLEAPPTLNRVGQQ